MRLENWGKWYRGSARITTRHPMFRQYRNGYFRGDTPQLLRHRGCRRHQKIMKDIPEPQRIAHNGSTSSQAAHAGVLRGVNKADLLELIHRGRTMAKNLVNAKEVA